MNDSFLEDLQLVETDNKQATARPPDRHVTTRAITSTPLQVEKKFESLTQKKLEHSGSVENKPVVKKLGRRDVKYLFDDDQASQQSKVRMVERREKLIESKLKPIENKVKQDTKEPKEHLIKDDVKKKIQNTRIKILESKTVGKEQKRRSGSCKENSSASSKENSYQSSISRESSVTEVCKERGKKCNTLKKSDNDPVVSINTLKDLISTYTKEESAKILRTMAELHMNSQANLIKSLIFQTEEIIKEIHPRKDSTRMRSLIEENERLQEDVIILQKKNEDLQRKLEEFELLKQENITLKLKCKELMK